MKNTGFVRDVHLAIEQVEREAWFDMYAAAPAAIVQRTNIAFRRLGTAIGLADRGTPIAEFNRVLGLGIDEPASEDELERAIAWMKEHAVPSHALQLAPTARPEGLPQSLEARGYRRTGNGWAKYYRDASPAEGHPIPTALEVKLVRPEDAAHFGQVVQAGFGLPAAVADWQSALVGRPKWNVYAAYDGGVPVACGAMFIDGGWAWLGVDATLAEYRGRGAQNALIERRIADGIAAGVSGFTAETGQPSEGEERKNKSYGNYHRAGFTRLYVRPNYVLPQA
ncbi:GNAT family N-acetyltransferase [Paenibacillus sp. MWE-103]|uniref:GNAT family N-acetyltransferase n=1 Tax=Paenibacillus artemisiicola TaxID=1172618 RepID=A0ABS3WBB8_9BACL|nr:GNAT family N-acetyltransferase [Paenibacillus artemisiicola]MBO7745405.1 GNAT family N-acetyltransferase [Paenibacillus artemisiicola]